MNTREKNIIIYLATKVPTLSKTKLLKLIYLIDETSVINFGVPITDFDYKVWKDGPVARSLYTSIQNAADGYHSYLNFESLNDIVSIHKENDPYGSLYFSQKDGVNPDLDCFSEVEVEIVDEIIENYGNCTARQLINLLHKKNTLWSKEVLDNKLDFENSRTTNISINFNDLVKDNELLNMAYQCDLDNRSFL